jgi:hypothetical protein
MSPERNYKGTGEKILSEDVLDKKALQVILDIGLDFISEEIEINNPDISRKLVSKSKDVQEYLPYITLVRLIGRYKEAESEIRKANHRKDVTSVSKLSEAKSVQLFAKLKENYVQKLRLSDEVKSDITFDTKLIDTICCTPGFFDEDKYLDRISENDMKSIANWAAEIVPGNPKIAETHTVQHILD